MRRVADSAESTSSEAPRTPDTAVRTAAHDDLGHTERPRRAGHNCPDGRGFTIIKPFSRTPMFKKLKALTHEMGGAYLLPYLAHRVLVALTGGWAHVEAFLLVAQPVAAAPLLPARRGADISLVSLTPGDPLLKQLPRPQSVIADRYRQGAHGFAAVRDGQLLGCIWLIMNRYDEDVVRIRYKLPASGCCAWDFDVYVDPAHRLGFTFAKLWDAANAFLRERGVSWSLSRISAFNRASLSSHSRMGARELGWVTVLTLGQVEFLVSNCQPGFHVSWGRGRADLELPDPG